MQRVLVIDDNEDLRELMRAILTRGGYAVVTAALSVEAVQVHRADPFDLVVCDLFMPVQDGLETIDMLRRSFPALKIVAVSGGGRIGPSPSYLATALVIGADAALSKPFEPAELLATVRRLLGDSA